MKRKCLALFLVAMMSCWMWTALPFSAVLAEEESDLMSEVLAELSLSREQVRFTDEGIERTYGTDPLRLPFFNQQLKNPLATPAFLESNANYIATRQGSMRDLLWLSAFRLGYTVSSYPQYEPVLDHRLVESQPLLYAISDLHTFCQEPLDSYSFALLKKKLEAVPLVAQTELARILYASLFFKEQRDKAFSAFSQEELMTVFRNPAKTLVQGYDPLSHRILKEANFALLYFASIQLGKTLDKSVAELKKQGFPPDWDLEWKTPMGRIILKGSEKHTHSAKEVLLSVDSGGDDSYLSSVGATASWFNPVSIHIDGTGNDRYLQSEDDVYSQGAGILGMGVLIDLQGDDHYETVQYAQGFGCFGVGLLVDDTGNDSYTGISFSQGAGIYGVGYLIDREGEDKYDVYSFSQGFGYVKSFGCLLDMKGNDSYIANDEDVDGSNPQSSEHNTSFCQGAGFGRRADLEEGNSMSGGFGLLIDMEGKDSYSCGVFGQGTGYWAGTGLLYDAKGDDEYKGVWYVQGGAAHFAIAALIDKEGNDRYDALLNMAQGAGHDLSLGFLIDSTGNDHYISPNLALGGGNDNGMGFFVDGAGDDVYETRGAGAINLGKANYSKHLWGSWRDKEYSLGIFIDSGGKDAYPEDRGKNDTKWNYFQDGAPKSMGAGIDAETGRVPGWVVP